MTTKPDPDALVDDIEPGLVYLEDGHSYWTADIDIDGHYGKVQVYGKDQASATALRDRILAALRAHSPEASRVGEEAAMRKVCEAVASRYDESWSPHCIERGLGDMARAALTPSEPVSPTREDVEDLVEHIAENIGPWSHNTLGKWKADGTLPTWEQIGSIYRGYYREVVLRVLGSLPPAALSASQPGMGERGWRPIETAPKDGTRIIGISSEGQPFNVFWFTNGDGDPAWCTTYGWVKEGVISRWMPLPSESPQP